MPVEDFSYGEEFDDGVLNGAPWTFYRRTGAENDGAVQEYDGLLHIFNDRTDNGGYARVDFEEPVLNATVQIEEFQHSTNRYYLASTTYFLTDSEGESFYIQVTWYKTAWLNENTADGTNPKLSWTDSDGETVKHFAEIETADLLDIWFENAFNLDSETGRVTVDLDGDGVLDFDVTDPRFVDAGLSGLLFNAYGWWTGQYRLIDRISVETGTPPTDEPDVPEVPTPDYVVLRGNERANLLIGRNDQDDAIYGRGGRDYLIGRGGDDLLDGGRGGDTLAGGTGSDIARGGRRGDEISGGGGGDSLRGGAGDDTLSGGGGDDVLYDGAGDDRLLGDAGDDVFHFRGGLSDRATGGDGADTFALSGRLSDNGSTDRITIADYQAGIDIVDLGGNAVASVETFGNRVELTLAADGDTLILRGIGAYDQITFV